MENLNADTKEVAVATPKRLGARGARRLEEKEKITTPEQTIDAVVSKSTGTNSLSIRVQDGQMVSLALSLQFQLPPDTLKDLYVQYGSYVRYRSFLIPALSQRIRQVCQKHTSEDFFHARAAITSEIKEKLKTELEARHARLVGLQMHTVTWPPMLDAFIVRTEGTKYTMVTESAARQLEQQRAVAAASVLRLQGEIEMLQSKIEIAGGLEVKRYNTLKQEETTVTDMAVRRVATKAQTGIHIYTNTTVNLVAKLDLRKAKVQAETALRVLRAKKANDQKIIEYHQQGLNLLLPEQARLLGVEEGSRQLLANMTATQQKSLSAYRESTKFLEAKAMQAVVQLKEQALLESAQVQRRTDLAITSREAETCGMDAAASASKLRAGWKVVQSKLEGQAQTEAQVLARLGGEKEGIGISVGTRLGGGEGADIVQEIDGERGLGMTGREMVHLSWLEAYGALQKSGAVRGMEVSTPAQLRIM